MTTIIAGMFSTVLQAEEAMDQLLGGEFSARDVCTFANNPPGQHGSFPIGGDENVDPGAKAASVDAGEGAAVGLGTGAAIGAIVGGPPGAAMGAGVGAFLGSLAGALHGMEGRGTKESPVRRPAGIVVAVKIESGKAEQTAISTLQTHGAIHVEKAEGQWKDGNWIDFDPVSAPVILHGSSEAFSAEPREALESLTPQRRKGGEQNRLPPPFASERRRR